jgi:hypothetical protein
MQEEDVFVFRALAGDNGGKARESAARLADLDRVEIVGEDKRYVHRLGQGAGLENNRGGEHGDCRKGKPGYPSRHCGQLPRIVYQESPQIR